MTKQEFQKYVSKHIISTPQHYEREKLREKMHNKYTNQFNSNTILDFFCEWGGIILFRVEQKSSDLLTINIDYFATTYFYDYNPVGVYYWDDIDNVVAICVKISNCAGVIEHIYISESGNFYNDNHILVANTIENLFDYITTTEYDFHPIIKERTYQFLRQVGWYRGRKVDVKSAEKFYDQNEITITQAQKDFLSEFSGLYFDFVPSNYYVELYSIEEIVSSDYIDIIDTIEYNGAIVDKNAIRIGEICSGGLYLTNDGLLYDEWHYLLGRTALECFNHLFDYAPNNIKLNN